MNTPEDPPERLRRLQDGDPQAVEEMLGKYLPELRGFVRLQCGPALRSKEGVSDIVQSCCREVLRGMRGAKFEDEHGFKRALFLRARHKVVQKAKHYHFKKRDAQREVPLDADDGLTHCYSKVATPSEALAAKEFQDFLESAFEKLPPNDREVITMRRILGLSTAEVAEELEKTEANVRLMLSRALGRLSTLLDQGGR